MLLEMPLAPTQEYAPVQNLVMYLTQDCNLRCSYCFVDKQPKTMTSATARRTVDYFLQRNISGSGYYLHLNFFGGEPFLAVDLMQEVVDYARQPRVNLDKVFRFGATTNGTLANPRVERVIREAAMELLVSLDGGAQDSLQRLTVNGRESYGWVAKNLPKLAAWASACVARLTFTPDSLNLVERVQQVLSLAPVSIALCPVLEGDWLPQRQALEQAYLELGDWFLQQFAQGQRPPLTITWELLAAYSARLGCQQRPERACPLGHSLLAVDSEGQILPCHRFLHQGQTLGRVEDLELPGERWDYVALKNLEIPDCPSCNARTVCGGGCRAVALQSGRGLAGIHPHHCLNLQAHMAMVERIYTQLKDQPRFWDSLSPPSQGGILQLAQLGS